MNGWDATEGMEVMITRIEERKDAEASETSG